MGARSRGQQLEDVISQQNVARKMVKIAEMAYDDTADLSKKEIARLQR